jgi:DNA-binding response OmpR family regulator
MIMIVENDAGTRSLVAEIASGLGHKVVVCSSLSEAYQSLTNARIELAIIDRVLDDGDGLELVEYLHEASFATKTILLSQLSETTQRILGLEQGADEYLAKPFSVAELKLKLRMLLQREKRKQHETLRAGMIELEPETGTLKVGQHSCTIRKRVSQILAYLLRHKNQVVSREMLIEYIWASADEQPTQATIDVYVRRIRMLLKEQSSQLRTIRGFGYMLVDRE